MKMSGHYLAVVSSSVFHILAIALTQEVVGQSLPEWSPEDRVRLKKGELIAGAGLLIDNPPANDLAQPAPDPSTPSLPEEISEPPYDPELIPAEFLDDYFSKAPSSYLIDPQQLLSGQEAIDREGFLEYHAEDSEVDIRLYLFDAQQIIPTQYTLQELAEKHYSKSRLTAVVFCFLGDPSRNRLALSGNEADSLETLEVRKMLEGSLVKAMEKSDASAQVEAFVVQLSIKLYWLEQTMADAQAQKLAKAVAEKQIDSAESNGDESGSSAGVLGEMRPYLLYIVVGVIGVCLVLLASGGIFFIWKKNRRYHFPVLDLPRRLGADYAAGVGAVIAFHNKYGSPATQRDQVPDYLKRT